MLSRRHIFFILLLFTSVMAVAQVGVPVYFRYNHVTANADSADFYRVIDSLDGDKYWFTEHHKDGTWSKALATAKISDPLFMGNQTFYYKNGRVAVINTYVKGRRIKTTGYYPNGRLLQVMEYWNGWPQELVIYDADSSGTAHIEDGNGRRQETDSIRASGIHEHYTMNGPYKNGFKDGLWTGTDDHGFTFEQLYEAGKQVSGTTKTADGKKYRYTKIFEYPKFKGDIDQFEARIIPALKNPADTTGLVFFKPGLLKLSYVINVDGKVTNLTGIQKSSRKPVQLQLKNDLPRCEPARLRGVPINYQVAPNTDYIVRHNFNPFQTDVYLNGRYTLR